MVRAAVLCIKGNGQDDIRRQSISQCKVVILSEVEESSPLDTKFFDS